MSRAAVTGDLAGPVVGFARTLRAAGVDASPDRVHAFLAALDRLGAADDHAVYWAGRLTLCAGPDDLARYDRVFAAFFAGTPVTGRSRTHRRVRVASEAAGTPAAGDVAEGAPDADVVTRDASSAERLAHRDVTTLDAHEREELHRLLAAFRVRVATRRSRRTVAAHRGRIDRRATVRRMLAAGAEPGRLHHRGPRSRARPVVLLLDVSGSMAGYAEVLLRFAHAAARGRATSGRRDAAVTRTEVFTLGTRLTRVTTELSHRDPDTAMRAVAAAVPDWGGGTRLTPTLREFLDRYGQRGLARGAVVVVLSDGWETGDVVAFGDQVARLGRLAHRLVWANPRAGRPGFAPTAGGMAAALPYCDALVEGHSLAALERLATVVAGAEAELPPDPEEE